MAFLFQITFPADHLLCHHTMAMFMTLDGVSENLVVPPFSCGELSRGPVKPTQLVEQQVLHGAYLFGKNDLQPRSDLLSPVEPHCLVTCEYPGDGLIFGRMGPDPEWLQHDETPGALNDRVSSVFAFSIEENLGLPRSAGGPCQIELDFFAPDEWRARTDGYELFVGNAVYFFSCSALVILVVFMGVMLANWF
ncbi:hypothetical protein [Aureimonas sp. ME7]|uniref:hypothetical protein n=1 Tax=Aureimonas sp. ME7 TaxID=2744252 RepID=UPI0015FD8E26|nr:hypothetical protein [Aureimonas sp. ME7]